MFRPSVLHRKPQRLLMPPLVHYLRLWDVSSSARVDSFVANAQTVARRKPEQATR